MFRDEQRYEVWNRIRQQDVRAFSGLLTPAALAEAARRAGVRVVASPLCAFNLAWLGIAAALRCTDSFACVLTTTLKLLEDQQQFPRTPVGRAQKNGRRKKHRKCKHDPRRNDPTAVSEEAFAKARRRLPLEFWINLIVVLGDLFEAKHAELHRFRSFRILALDGTRIDLPNRQALRDHFGAAKNHSGSHQVQGRMVMLQFPFTRLPYRYRLDPVKTGETTMALRLVESLRPGDLVLLDAGFWSYRLLWAIAQRGAYFAIRQIKGLNVTTLRRLRPDGKDRLSCWQPKDSRGQWRKLGLPKSMDLRIVDYCIPGFLRQAVVTNVLDPRRISRDDWTRLTTSCGDAGKKLLPGLFHRRWEIETTYYELKVHQGLDRHLRSRTVESTHFEVAGHVVLYLLVRWLMTEAAVKHGLDPLRLSYLHAKRELEAMRPALLHCTTAFAARVLLPRLLDRIAEHQVPVRPGRHYPRKKKRTKPSEVTKKG